jgi:hypothetical protein
LTFDVHCFGRRRYLQHPECKQSEPKFNIKELNQVEGKEQCRVEISTLENLDTEVILIEPWKLLERISKFQPKRVKVIVSRRSISHGSMMEAQNY